MEKSAAFAAVATGGAGDAMALRGSTGGDTADGLSLPFRLALETVDPSAEPASDGVAEEAVEEETLALLRRASRLDPAEADYHFMLGDALSRAGRHGEAMAALEEAVRMAAANPAYRTAVGVAQLRCERSKEALTSLKEAVRLRPDDPRGWNALGVAFVRLGRAKKAADAFRISCVYRVPVRILPATTRTLRFSINVEEPFVASDSRRLP